jgi:hypothetical protein
MTDPTDTGSVEALITEFESLASVAAIDPRRSVLRVAFHRDGKEVEGVLAPDGELAIRTALMMLARLDTIRAGDKIEISEL